MARPPLFAIEASQLAESQQSLCHWFAGKTGRAWIKEQQSMLSPWLQQMFGYHMLQLGVSSEIDFCEDALVRHCFSLSSCQQNIGSCQAVSHPAWLPLESDSIDVVLLHHLLEYVENPHAVLKEATRVVAPHGYLVLMGFNPWSLWGIYHYFHRLKDKSPWYKHMLAIKRLEDWLGLLELKIVSVNEAIYLPGLKRKQPASSMDRLYELAKRYRLPGGAIYMIVARKENVGVTPLRKRWRTGNTMLPIRKLKPGVFGQPPVAVETALKDRSTKNNASKNT